MVLRCDVSRKTRLAIEMARQVASAFEEGVWFVELAERGEEEQAEKDRSAALFVKCVILAKERSELLLIVASLEGLARLAATSGNHQQAARLLGAIAARREAIGSPLLPHERPQHEQVLASVKASLGEAAFAAAFAAGRSLTMDEAAACGIEGAGVPHGAVRP